MLRILDGGADLVAEPGIDPEIEEQRGEDRHDDGGRDGDHAEQQHHAGMQPGARQAPAPLHPESDQAPGKAVPSSSRTIRSIRSSSRVAAVLGWAPRSCR